MPLKLKYFVPGRKAGLIFLTMLLPWCIQGQPPYEEYEITIHKESVNTVQFHPNGTTLLSASSDRTCKLYDIPSHKVLLTIPFEREVHAAAFTPNGKFILAGAGPLLKVYSIEGEYYQTYKGHSTAIWSIETGPGNRYVVTGSYDKAFYLWDIIEGKRQQTFSGYKKSVLAVAFAPSGKFVASGSLDHTVRIWKPGQPDGKITSENHSGNIVDLAFSPNSNLLASASRDKQVILWDVQTGEKITSLMHPYEVFSVAFSPDGTYLISGTLQGDIFLWDYAQAARIATMKGHKMAVLSLAFRPDGKLFASGSYDGTIRLWNPAPELFVQYAFPDSLQETMGKSDLNMPRKEGESRAEFKLRQEQLQEFRNHEIERLYQIYLNRKKSSDIIHNN